MLRDVFYYGNKPNVHPRERFAKDLADAKAQSTTEHFWIINEYCDYRGFDWDFDFEFLPDEDVWAEEHYNVWPSQHQKDSGTWLCNTDNNQPLIIYRADVAPIIRKNIKTDNWIEFDKVDHTKFDFSWHPDPTDPPYIYKWGSKFAPVQLKTCLEYHTPGATQIKYMDHIVELLSNDDCWVEFYKIDIDKFDMSWRPNPLDPPLIYVWGNKYFPAETAPTLEYHVPGGTERKFMPEKLAIMPNMKNWDLLENIDKTKFDFAWIPDPSSPPYIYAWGNQWNKVEDKISVQYVVEGATEYKYMTGHATRKPCIDNWQIPPNVDVSDFDFSWEPSPADPAFIYQFGTQWQKTGGPRYVVEGATEVKFIEIQKAKALPTVDKWTLPSNIDVTDFDFSWHPDDTSPPYIYVFPTQWALSGGPIYTVDGATEIKYVEDMVAKAVPDKTNWEVPAFIDSESFDFSWHPYAQDEPYIYQFGTQWQKTGGPVYKTPGVHKNSAIKYIDTRIIKAKRLPSKKGFATLNNYQIKDFDYSWHPDTTDEPYIYVFGNSQYPAEIMPTIEYVVPGATQIKYVNDIVATLGEDKTNWEIPENIDTTDFDFSWKPNPKDPPFIYVFGTQWQRTGGPRYVVPDATELKFVDTQKVKALPTKTNWTLPSNIDAEFDFSWHPDDTSPPYIYYFATQWALSGGPVYTVPGATEVKYVEDLVAKALPDMTNWEVPEYIDKDAFDYSWHPYVEDEPYIYQFGTQWQKTGGPVYKTPGVHKNSPTKYIDVRILRATRLPSKRGFATLGNLQIANFDYTWHPDTTDEPYIYVFGNNYYPAEIMPTIEYAVPGAKQIKYVNDIVATLGPDRTNWIIVQPINEDKFDFSWKPNPKDPPYIYVWGNSYIDGKIKSTVEYHVEGATEKKYMEELVDVTPEWDRWDIPENIDTTQFDFTWRPDPLDADFIWQFGTQHQKTGGPRYIVPGATEIKYIDFQKATARPSKLHWEVPTNIDVAEFDFSWHPDATEAPYIYVFGTQWALTGGPKYIAPGATEVKYIDTIIAKAAPNRAHWFVPDNIDTSTFDFSWHPYAEDEPFIYQFGTQWQKTGGPVYTPPNADATCFTKYIDTRVLKSTRLPTRENWVIPDNIDESSIDFSWHPDETESPYIYHFGTQWNNRGGPEYVVPGATEYKYSSDIVAKTKPNRNGWRSLIDIEEDKFDYSWVPHPEAPPYIYVFGNQWNAAELEPTVEFVVEGATEKKYIHDIVATVAHYKKGWNILENVKDFDFSWRPNPTDPAYIYVFGNKQYPGNIMPTVTLTIEGATQEKFVDDIVATIAQDPSKFTDTEFIKEFDYSWRPNPKDPPYIYQFGTQWAKTHGPKFIVEGATEVKYIEDIKAVVLPNMTNWEIPDGVSVTRFDFSWHPDGDSPPYIYQFGTITDPTDGPRYIVPGATEVVNMERIELAGDVFIEYPKYFVETTLEALVEKHKGEVFWALNSQIDYTDFDFNWRPDIQQAQYVHAFGSSESETTQTYFVNANMWMNGHRELNWVVDEKLDEQTLAKLFKKPDMFFVDRGNKESQARFEKLKAKFDNIQKTRYLNTWVDTINRCINRSSTNLCWILNSELDYDNFDFEYYPNPWQMKMVHVFGTQWSHWGTTFMVNRETFANDTKYIKIIEHLSCLNFVKDRRAVATNRLYDVVYIDHGNEMMYEADSMVIKYEESYLNTFKKLVSQLPEKKEHYIWVCSSICDYQGFDFTYICDPFAREQLHVFPSDKQKFGDTFLVNVNKLRELISDMEKLEDYTKINYNQHQRVKRLPAPVIITEEDTHVSIVNSDYNWPYATFVTADNKEIQTIDTEPMSLWAPEHKNILITSVGGTRITAPKEVKNHVKRELYDYPYIITNSKLVQSSPLDIVFLSNGETGADENYEHLLNVTKGLKNRVTRVDGVNGRVAAYHAAAEASNTPWMFTVFAKLKVSLKFDWNWQPDRLQVPKHYVFHAKNPVNGLVYGHQAMIAYNKKLTLANEGKGLDFTMDDEHEIVDIVSGIANFNTDEWSTWRTAFREALKLCANDDEVSKNRLEFWLTVGSGKFSDYSIEGAQHAVAYYKEVNGDFEKLKLSYDWAWLRQYFDKLYK